jgi:predicted RNA binding protein YcfA (HicA-like mRNA interferase family)
LPKLAVLSGRAVCAILALHGFAEVRQRGSHVVMQKKNRHHHDYCPFHAEIRIGTLLSTIRQSGVQRTEFER